MALGKFRSLGLVFSLTLILSACGGSGPSSIGNLGNRLFGGFGLGGPQTAAVLPSNPTAGTPPTAQKVTTPVKPRRKWFQLRKTDPDLYRRANKYIWQAALDTLNYLPIQSQDQLTGIITTGYGRAPGSSRTYRATIHVNGPALDAQTLRLSLQTRGGGSASAATVRAVEDAILGRARQLRIADRKSKRR